MENDESKPKRPAGAGPQKFSLYHIAEGTADFTHVGARSADDYLAKLSNGPIPVRPRSEDFHLPDTDLLKSIHYFIANEYPHHFGLFDESALLAFGYLVEHWVEEELHHKTYLQYAQMEGTEEVLERRRLRRELKNKKSISLMRQRELNGRLELERKRALESDNDSGTDEEKDTMALKREKRREDSLKHATSTPIVVKSRKLKTLLSRRSREGTPTIESTTPSATEP